jgi:LmbE family N-acetylglucosaminyl deacetylase/CheY-like chemotaxis protein
MGPEGELGDLDDGRAGSGEPGRPDESVPEILLVSGNPETVELLGGVLRGDGMSVHVARTGAEAVLMASTRGWDLLIFETSAYLEREDVLELRSRRDRGWPTPVLVLSYQPTVDLLIGVLRARADDFMALPADSVELLERIHRMVDWGRRHRGVPSSRSVVLAIGAHPDDVEIGAGGTLAAHTHQGDAVHILTLTRGDRGGDADRRAEESGAAATVLGARLWLEDFEDTRITEGGSTVRRIEGHVARLRPSVVYTHSLQDNHQDHRNVHKAVMVATRTVPRVYCFESPSSTVEFSPSRYVQIDPFMETKLKALHAYGSQIHIRSYLSESRIRAAAHYWSRFSQGEYAEPFEVVREVRDANLMPGPNETNLSGLVD